ncbi:MAG: chemotaxis response regulator protein-glutamate methylesterase [Paucibacter sp.]|nr:chemotaxis response regulator protein-glutamate methylesterase [Roseateles sp.]
MTPGGQVRVLIVDDSAVVRQVLSVILQSAPGIEVLHAVADPLLAMDRMRTDWPDVIVLDVDMPRMDGITFLRKIMAERPTPVVICSAVTERGTAASVEALAAGAVSVITKPRSDVRRFLEDIALELITAVNIAASANVARLRPMPPARPPGSPAPGPASNGAAVTGSTPAAPAARSSELRRVGPPPQLVAIGTSTGGTQALEALLTPLAPSCPPICVVQHMPEKFTAAFAKRLNGLAQISIIEAQASHVLRPGMAVIAQGGRHLQVRRDAAGQLVAEVLEAPPVKRHRPSVDVLFRSVARSVGAQALGVILTGMGDDGAAGMAQMKESGAHTIAQDEASCVVFGMPREAIKLGAVDQVLSLADIGRELRELSGLTR